MNFEKKFRMGMEGFNRGLPMGIDVIDKFIGGIHRASIYGLGAAPKVGKTTKVDYCFVLTPYLHMLKERSEGREIDIDWIYFSYEINRVRKEFKYISFFMYYDHNITHFTHKGKRYEIDTDYLMSRKIDEDGEIIHPSKEHIDIIFNIYERHIVPLFGRYDEDNNKIGDGYIDFVEIRDKPTGVRNYIFKYTDKNGTWKTAKKTIHVSPANSIGKVVKKEVIVKEDWIPNNPEKFTIIITDHLRKLKSERGYSKKETVDKMIEYQVEFRNWCGFTFVDIIHLNRSMSNMERIKYQKEFLFPTGDDIKETGNLSEDADFLFTMMNPNDERYGIDRHFGLDIRDRDGSEIYPHLRTIHLVEARDHECPTHFKTIIKGNQSYFKNFLEGGY